MKISKRYFEEGNMKKNSRCKLHQMVAVYVLFVLVTSFWIRAGYGERPSEEEYKKALKTVEAAMEKMAKSKKQDELTQLAREHVKTKKKIAKLKKEIAERNRKAKSVQKSQCYTERIFDLSHDMFEIGLEQYSQREVIDIMSSNKPEHRKLREAWFNEARRRAGL